jgi:hypothetical protein
VGIKRTQIILKPSHSKALVGMWPTAESSTALARQMQSKTYRKKICAKRFKNCRKNR